MSFDWGFYVNKYPDLRKAGINTYQKAIAHWNLYGKKEGRICNPDNVIKTENNIINNDITLDDNYLVRTRQFNTPAKIQCPQIDNLDDYTNFILIIDFSNGGGGTTHFINCIVSKFKTTTTFLIARNFNGLIYFYINDTLCLKNHFNLPDSIKFLDIINHKIIKIFVNHIIGHNVMFLNKLFELGKHITAITHDYSLIVKKSQPYYSDITKGERATIDIKKYDMIITQNIVNKNIFSNYINSDKIVICKLPDYYKTGRLIKTNNSHIVVAFIGSLIIIKGSEIVNKIYEFYKHNKFIKFIIFGLMDIKTDIPTIKYNNIEEFNDLLLKYKPNLLIETSISPETYSYTLTLSMLTNLPILYFKKSFPSVIENRLSTYKKAYPFMDITNMDVLLLNISQNYFYTIDTTIKFEPFWDNYFNKHIYPEFVLDKKDITNNICIKAYCIYFPQFHTIPENDINFYKGYTDIENLKIFKNTNNDVLSPSLHDLDLNELTDYNLLNKNIIQRQIDIIADYDISGFAMYYYWFSNNSISNNMLMKSVIDNFFNDIVNMRGRKIFFIWANESWTNNDAFGDNIKHKIINTYNEDDLIKNIDNLIPYFNNVNYLKIDNKPLFFLHHPWFLTDDEINTFYHLLNSKCIQNNYNGVHLIINSMSKYYNNFINYHHTFNYKHNNAVKYDSINKIYELDYNKYVNDYNNNSEIHTLAFDFDNRVRLFKPNKLDKATVCINNDDSTKIKFIHKLVNKYDRNKKSEVEDILLINSWNEWGEKLAIEPSEEQGHYYLNLIKKYILSKD